MRRLSLWTVVLWMPASAAWALSSFASYLPNGSAQGCVTCHVDPAGGGARNVFGEDVRARLLNGAPSWPALEGLDSDADGFTNGEEMGDPCACWVRGRQPMFTQDLSFPGDTTSTPSMHTLPACTGTCPVPDAGSAPDTPAPSGNSGCGGNSAGGEPPVGAAVAALLALARNKRRPT